jgi:hypothetical protein
MFRTASVLGATIGLVALVVGDPAVLRSAAQAQSAGVIITDISSARVNVVRGAPRANVRSTPRVNAVRSTARVRSTPRVNVVRSSRTVTGTQFRKLNVSGPGGGPKFKKPGPGNRLVSPAQLNPNKLQLGPGKIKPVGPKPGNFPVIKVGNKIAPIWKGPKKIWWGGGWKTFIPLSAIGVVLVGGTYFYPDGYLGIARPYCEGITPDGCRLNWQMVNFEGGGSDWQCVQFCPRRGVLPPPQATALVAPPPIPQGRCEVAIYPEPSFAGTVVATGEEQPRLSESGWQNQIASIQVRAGTWDFYSDENFTGETMRLPPGPYPTLGPEWTKHIGSFMCSQPGG